MIASPFRVLVSLAGNLIGFVWGVASLSAPVHTIAEGCLLFARIRSGLTPVLRDFTQAGAGAVGHPLNRQVPDKPVKAPVVPHFPHPLVLRRE